MQTTVATIAHTRAGGRPVKIGFLIAVTAAVLAVAPVQAADMPVKAPAIKAPAQAVAYNWTGIYVGIHGGGDWFTKDWNAPFTPINIAGGCGCGPRGSHSDSNWLLGAQVGFNYQLDWALFGIEAQASWTNLEASNLHPGAFAALVGFTDHSKTDVSGTIAARLGAAWGRQLFYVKGGAAWAHDKFWTSDNFRSGHSVAHGDALGLDGWCWRRICVC
jgi:outer membrane immunogenic protein